MDVKEAEERARKAVIAAFVVTNTASFEDSVDEEETEIQLIDEAAGQDVRQLGVGVEGDHIWYVTLSLDSTAGDGHFRITAKVDDEGERVVDFEALP